MPIEPPGRPWCGLCPRGSSAGALLEQLRGDLLGEVRAEVGRQLQGEGLARLRREVAEELQGLRQELAALRAAAEARAVADASGAGPHAPAAAEGACAGGLRRWLAAHAAADASRPRPPPSASPPPCAAPAGRGAAPRRDAAPAEEPAEERAASAPASGAPPPRRPAGGPAAGGGAGGGEAGEGAAPAAVRAASTSGRGLLPPVLAHWRAAAVWGHEGELCELRRAPLIDGFEAMAGMLDQLGGGMGSYILADTKKMRASQASPSEDEYRAWLVSELPVHAATKYREYLDNSAWMANLWIGWSLEFFVELFAHLHKGQDTKAGVDLAYKQTLSKHHNILQRTAFSAAVKKLPSRQHLLERLRGDGASAEDVSRDLAAFVALGHAIARCCSQVNEDLKALQVREREALRVR